MSYSSIGYGYDDFTYDTDFRYQDETNYNKPIKEKTFQDRVNEKRNSLNANSGNSGNSGNTGLRMNNKNPQPCNCVDCAPELYKKSSNSNANSNTNAADAKSNSNSSFDSSNQNVYYIGFTKDTIYTFIILILCILSFVMYFKIKKLARCLKSLQMGVLPQQVPQQNINI